MEKVDDVSAKPACQQNPAGGMTPAKAWGEPVASGSIRGSPRDFLVAEQLGFEPSGEGQHVLLELEKSGRTTLEAAKMLADHAGIRAREIGYSGLKDKHAVCTQWFSAPYSSGQDWEAFNGTGVRVLRFHRHHRKLRRGSHRANRFTIRVVLDTFDRAGLEDRLQTVRLGGVPSYFGEQRFGQRYAGNAELLVKGARLSRPERSMTLSALRSELYNRVLDRRVRAGTWNRALPGEYVNLDGTRSGFAAGADDPDITARIEALDLHPTGPLYGRGGNPASGEVASLEGELIGAFEPWGGILVREGLRFERRAARCVVRGLEWRLDESEGVLELVFVLRRGEFATSVLREIVDYRDVTRQAADGSV